MKLTFLSILAVVVFISCKEEKKQEIKTAAKELNVLDQIAEAHGYVHWKNVEELKFTFNVDRDTSHFERSWIWNTRTNQVTGILNGDTIPYDRGAVDSTLVDVDAGFINDKYWLLAPFNLVWDRANFSYEHKSEALAPMSRKPMQKLTIVYSSEGGYTPGDAYDFYFEEDHIIKEWVFRKANQDDPSLITSWEGYVSFEGLLLSQEHRKNDDSWTLSFTDISVR